MDFDNIKRIGRRALLATEKVLLTPLSWGYGAGVWLRNTAFNIGLLKEEAFGGQEKRLTWNISSRGWDDATTLRYSAVATSAALKAL